MYHRCSSLSESGCKPRQWVRSFQHAHPPNCCVRGALQAMLKRILRSLCSGTISAVQLRGRAFAKGAGGKRIGTWLRARQQTPDEPKVACTARGRVTAGWREATGA